MTPSEFEAFVIENGRMGIGDDAYNVIGLTGEAGEVAEWVKKVILRKNPKGLTEEDLLKELGDVLHYVTRIAINHGWTLEQVMKANREKLLSRGWKGD